MMRSFAWIYGICSLLLHPNNTDLECDFSVFYFSAQCATTNASSCEQFCTYHCTTLRLEWEASNWMRNVPCELCSTLWSIYSLLQIVDTAFFLSKQCRYLPLLYKWYKNAYCNIQLILWMFLMHKMQWDEIVFLQLYERLTVM